MPSTLPVIASTADFAEYLDTSEARVASRSDLAAGLCPKGHGILSRTRIEPGSEEDGFYLERCHECLGVFFDAGEWTRLAEHHLLQNLDDLWSKGRQREARARAETESREAWLREQLGDDLFRRLALVADDLRDHPARSSALAYLRDI